MTKNKNTISVLLLFSSSNIGGAEISLSRMAAHKSNSGIITYYAVYQNGLHQELYRIAASTDSYKIIELNKGARRFNSNFLTYFLNTIKLATICRMHDYIYIIGAKAAFIFRILSYLGYFNTPIIVGIRWNPASQSLLDIVIRTFEGLFSPVTNLWVSNSIVAARTLSLCKLPISKLKVIYNGVDIPHTPPVSKIDGLHIPKDSHIILTIANLVPRKGHIEYLEICAEVINNCPSAVFLFVGKDYMNGRVQLRIQEYGLSANIKYLGFRSNVYDLIGMSSIVTLPSLYGEGLPTSLVESACMGKPLVGYDVDGLSEIIKSDNGFLIKPYDKHKFAHALLSLIGDSQLYSRQSMASKLLAQNYFSIDTCASLHRKVFSNNQLDFPSTQL